ncbi:MAG: hypothetical protein HRF45_12320 [Fimbriimonadia bacterium]
MDSIVAPSYTPASLKWTLTPPEGVKAITGVVIGEPEGGSGEEPYEYDVFFGADDGKIYCWRIDYDIQSGTFAPLGSPQWATDLRADPNDPITLASGTPVLAKARYGLEDIPALYVCTRAGSGGTLSLRLQCLRLSDGQRLWKSVNLANGSSSALAPPLYAPYGEKSGSSWSGYRVYVARDNGGGDGPAHMMAFSTYYSPGNDAQPHWALAATGRIVSQPAFNELGIGSVPGGSPESYWPAIYATTLDGKLEQWFDDPQFPISGPRWVYNPPAAAFETHACETWPITTANDRVYYGFYFTSRFQTEYWTHEPNESGLYAVRDYSSQGQTPYGETRWPRLDPPWNWLTREVRTPPLQDRPLGKFLANPCADGGGKPALFFATMDAGSATGKPSLIRVEDKTPPGVNEPDATAKYLKALPYDTDEVDSGTIYRSSGPWVMFVTRTGRLWATSPFAQWSYPMPSVGQNIPRHDPAMGRAGALVIITANGQVRAYWGP